MKPTSTTHHFLVLVILSITCLTAGSPIQQDQDATTRQKCSARVRTLYQFPTPGSWYENLAVRSNGHILATRIDVAQVDDYDPFNANANEVPNLVATFPVDAMLGIVEYQPDLFAVVGGNRSGPGTYSLFKLDVSKGIKKPKTSVLARGPVTASFNGLTYLPAIRTFFAADPYLGVVWGYSLATDEWFVVSKSPLLAPSQYVALGVNGVRFLPDDMDISKTQPSAERAAAAWGGGKVNLYFTNTAHAAFGFIPISTTSGKAINNGTFLTYDYVPGSKPTSVNTSITSFDDFNFGPLSCSSSSDKHERKKNEKVYLATNFGNTIDRVVLDGSGKKLVPQRGGEGDEIIVIAGTEESTRIAGATATAFGRTKKDANTLYVVTSGDQEGPVNGTVVTGAQILALDLSRC